MTSAALPIFQKTPEDLAVMTDMNSQPVRLIAGMSRAGTTWMARCLNGHPELAAFGESRFFGRKYISPNRDGAYDARQLHEVVEGLKARILATTVGSAPGCSQRLNHREQKRIISDAFRDQSVPLTPGESFQILGRAIAELEGKPHFVEKTPQHINWVDRIVATLPNMRMVVMIRDPYAFMLSYKHQGDRKDRTARRTYARRYHPVSCALIWRGYIRSAFNAQQKLPHQVLLVRLEDAIERPDAVLDEIQDFFMLDKVPLAERVPPANSSFPAGERPDLCTDDVFWMNRIASREIRRYGATPRRTGLAARRIISSLISLPGWAVWNGLDLQKRIHGSSMAYLWRWMQ